MIVIDDNDTRILRMKERELEVSASNREVVLEEYKHLAIAADNRVYSAIVSKIEANNNYSSRSLSEQLSFLTEIEEDYVALNELQHKLQNTYAKYSDEPLTLSKISNILIDDIRNRIADISGYLISLKNIDKNNAELDRLYQLLVDEDKKNSLLKERLNSFESRLKEALLKTEGRVYDQNGDSVYTSVAKELEWQLLSIANAPEDDRQNLKELLNNHELLAKLIAEVTAIKNDLDERMQAAKICYETTQNINNRDIYESIKKEWHIANYKLVLLSLIEMIAKESIDYDEVVEKRRRIIEAISYRNQYLKELGIKYLYDPFDRLGVKEQLTDLNALGDNENVIKNIRREINELSAKNEEIKNNLSLLLADIGQDIELFKDDTSFDDVEAEIEPEVKEIQPNKVIKVHDINPKLSMPKVREKTTGVIVRVSELMSEKMVDEVVPNLVIEGTNDDLTENQDSTIELATNEVFPEIIPEEESPMVDDLFSDESQPFITPSLFSEKTDEGIFEDKKQSMIVDLTKNDNDSKVIAKINNVDNTSNSEEDSLSENQASVLETINSNDGFWPGPTIEESKIRKLEPAGIDKAA